MSDLNAMHYGRTGKDHTGENQSDMSEDGDVPEIGDEDLWNQLK